MRCLGEQFFVFGSFLFFGFGMMCLVLLGSDDGRCIVEDIVLVEDIFVVFVFWGLVIVIVGLDGKVRIFQNYGYFVWF